IFDSARELFRQEKYKEALSNLRYFMDLYPRSELAGPVSFLIGECYFHLAKEGVLRSYQPAVDAFQLALALYPDTKEAPGGLFQLANGYREMRYYYEAKENYEVLGSFKIKTSFLPHCRLLCWIEGLWEGTKGI
ncbi:MAG: hypothetical protein JRJ00_16845, partial [Deltaproteobacteria bacterium]|nr:hypothetical protein [Deltaproteobacteria bacterium]